MEIKKVDLKELLENDYRESERKFRQQASLRRAKWAIEGLLIFGLLASIYYAAGCMLVGK